MLKKLLWLSAAGAAGSVARVALSTWASRWTEALAVRWSPADPRQPLDWLRRLLIDGLPPGTMLVNVLGCALFGLAFALSEGRFRDLASFRLVILGGFMGAFTTFSTYAFETVRLVEQGRIAVALANVLVQNGLGMGALVLGLSLGKGS